MLIQRVVSGWRVPIQGVVLRGRVLIQRVVSRGGGCSFRGWFQEGEGALSEGGVKGGCAHSENNVKRGRGVLL